ncbi:pentapeptide repeat-containing protein [Campylobacter insulaenigrae]|uniref:pentapeptide repeat-containing protein n=1 Tax=Campylobacter insulaenigrae TaxID=260714 RepID=UPI0021535CA9|nr:pentapeptide repeat-containing protein [Campylobacter insulaenigrae]MCR6587515.1 pentapeptide repeat-containing protein [Campylobacter insulaenigrae]
MEYNRFDIGLEIENSGIFIIGLDNDILTVSLDLAKFLEINANKIESLGDKLDVGDIAKPLNPYDIFNTLENQGKNTYNNTKIIEKIETPDFIEYHFHYGLILNVFANKENKVILEHIKKKIPKKAFINPIYFSYDIIGDSNAIPQDEISDLTKNYGYERKNYKSIFKKEVYINYSCLERLYFANCEFKSKVSLHHIDGSDNLVTFFNGIDFANCIFEDEINFKRFTSGSPLPDGKYYNNEQNTLFENCIFKKRVDFHNSKFVNSVYFTNSHFKDYADFHACEFEKTACFYGVTFEKTPNFSQVVFKDSVNLVNIKTNFNFEILNTTINNIDKPKDESANDFRDSFRTFKSALIKENNPLEASNFHKYELYCKEIELRENWNKRGKKAQNMLELQRNTWIFRDFIDSLLLGFYRKLCEHHTDFLRVFNNLILLIALYALFVSVFAWRHDDKSQDKRKISSLFDFLYSFEHNIHIVVLVCFLLGSILILYKLKLKPFTLYKCLYIKKWIRKTFVNKRALLLILQDLCNLTQNLIFALFFVSASFYLGQALGEFLGLDKYFAYSLLINTLFIGLYICFVYTESLFFGRYIILISSYIVFLVQLIQNPSIIHPIIDKIVNDNIGKNNYQDIMVLNICYTVLMFLVLFSLQKTARKNSIIPT